MRGARQIWLAALAAPLLSSAMLSHDTGRAGEAQQASVELMLPRDPDADEAVWLKVRAGALPPGAEISVSTEDGQLLGTVSPFGVQQGREAGTYTIPVPEGAVEDGRVHLHLEVQERGGNVRPPLPGEVENLSLIFVPVTR